MTQTPPPGSPGGYPRHSSDWPGTSPQYGSGGVHYPSEMPAERVTEATRRQSTAGDKWVDRRLDKFGRLMGMRDRPESDPFRGHVPPTAPAAPAEPGPLAQQPAAAQPDADQVTGPQQTLSQQALSQQAQSQQVLSQQAQSQQAPSQAEARAPMYPDPGQPSTYPAPSYAEPGPAYAEPASHEYQAPQASAAAAGGAGGYLPGQQQAQNLGHGPYGDPGRPAATPPAAAQPASTGGPPAPPYSGQPAAAGLEYPYRAYSSQETSTAGQAQGYTAAPEPAAPEPAAQAEAQGYGTPSYAAPAYGAETYAAPTYGSQAYGSQAYGSQSYGAQSYGAQAPGGRAYGGQAPAAQTYGAQAPGAQTYAAQAPAAQTYGAQTYGAQTYGAQAPGAQTYGAQGYGARAYGTHPYAPDYSTQPYSPQGYAARQYPSPGNAGPEPSPAQGYAPASYAPASYGPPGYTGQDYGPAAVAEEPAAPSWEAGAAAMAAAPAPAFPAPLQDTPSAVAVAEPSTEPLYRVLGGLALRDLTLVESLLEIVEQLESREEDPQQLDSLFRVDHLATRMRRNSENLLVLAGQDRESQDFEPVSLLDVARAAVSEIADYDRAQVGQLPGVQLLGVAADDVTHILAELLDNAMSKSPESAEVVIRGERTGDGTLVVSVEDSGIGIPVDRLSEINTRLSRPPKVDVAVTRHMGLYVVGRLAHRHGIRVQLRERPYGGIAASVVIPAQLVGNDPDAPREIRPAEPAGRYQPLSGAGPQPPLSIEARGADGLRAQRAGGQESAVPFSGARSPAQQAARDADAALRAMPSAQSGIGWPAGYRQPADVAQERGFERPGPAPAAGYRDAVPVPKFEPADPSELPKRKPGALSAVNGIPAPETRREKAPVSAAEDPAIQSEADRIRSELSEFQLGQRAARSDLSGPGEQQRDYGAGTDADPGNGESLGDERAHNEAGENDGE